MYLILHQFSLILTIALHNIVTPILTNTFLYYFISTVLDHLHLLVFTLYHQYNINIKSECLQPRFIYYLGSLAQAKLHSSGNYLQGRKKRDMLSFRINLQREKWVSNNLLLWIRAELHSVASLNYPMDVSAAAQSNPSITQR
jgi:hypothetical protein